MRLPQDDFAGDASLGGDPDVGIFAVADGHGPNGRRVSQLLVKELSATIASEVDPKLGMDKVLKRAYLKLNVKLLKSQVSSGSWRGRFGRRRGRLERRARPGQGGELGGGPFRDSTASNLAHSTATPRLTACYATGKVWGGVPTSSTASPS